MAISEKIGDAFVEIGAQTSKLSGDLNSAKGMVTGWSDSMLSKMKGWAVGIGASIGAAFSFKTLVKDPLARWAEEEASANAMAAALTRQGAAARAMIPAFSALAKQIQLTTLFTEDDARAAITHASLIGISTDKIKSYTNAAVGLATILGTSLPDAMDIIIRAGNGYDRQLKMAGIQLDDTMSQEEKMAEILRRGVSAYGLAEEATRTLAGSRQQLTKATEEAQESLGKAIDRFFGMTRAISATADAMNNLSDSIEGLSPGEKTKKLSSELQSLTEQAGRLESIPVRISQINQQIGQAAESSRTISTLTAELNRLENEASGLEFGDRLNVVIKRIKELDAILEQLSQADDISSLIAELNRLTASSGTGREAELQLIQNRIAAIVEEMRRVKEEEIATSKIAPFWKWAETSGPELPFITRLMGRLAAMLPADSWINKWADYLDTVVGLHTGAAQRIEAQNKKASAAIMIDPEEAARNAELAAEAIRNITVEDVPITIRFSEAQKELESFILNLTRVEAPRRFTGAFGDAESTWRASQLKVFEQMNAKEEQQFRAKQEANEQKMIEKIEELVKKKNLDPEDKKAFQDIAKYTYEMSQKTEGGIFGP